MRRIRLITPDGDTKTYMDNAALEAAAELSTNGAIDKALLNKYNYAPLKEIKIKESGSKCVYCESKITATQYGELDHIDPKSNCISLAKVSLIYDYKNLALCCRICNERKANLGITSPLLSPYSNRPETHIVYAGTIPVGVTPLGRKTILALELDTRGDLAINIKNRLASIIELANNYNNEKDAEVKLLLRRRLIKESHRSKEYSSAVISILKIYSL